MALTKEQYLLLYRAEYDEQLTDTEKAKLPGFHFCPDWDFMAICFDSPEAEACTCPRSSP